MNITWTCLGCPMQAEGQLADGRWFYFRYRWGHASLGVGATFADAVADDQAKDMKYGDSLQGVLDTEEAEDLLWQLLAARLKRTLVRPRRD